MRIRWRVGILSAVCFIACLQLQTQVTNTPVKDDATARRKWMQKHFGDPRAFARRRLAEAEKQRRLYPSQAPGHSKTTGRTSTNLAATTTLTSASDFRWTSLGPTAANFETNGITLNVTDSGRLRSILPDPDDPNIVYVLSSGGGLWKTTNFLSRPPTWIPLTDDLDTTSGGAAALDPTDPNTIYLGLGDPFDTAMLVGGEVLKSTDGGSTWSPPFKLNIGVASLGDAASASSIRDLKVDVQTPGLVLVATDVGLFRSTDDGKTYQAIAAAPGEMFYGFQFWSLAQTSAGWLAAGIDPNDHGFMFLSQDSGMTWRVVNEGPTLERVTLAVGLPGDSVAYAFAGDSVSHLQLDLFRSTDGGITWTPLGITNKTPHNANPDTYTMDLMGNQAWYNQMVLVDPNDHSRNTVYLGGQLSSAKSLDGGNTWTLISNWLGRYNLPYVHADFHTAAFQPGTNTLLFGTDGGLFVSRDGGVDWDNKKNTGLVTFLQYTLTSSPSDPASTITGLQDDGTRVREENSSIFDQTLGGDGMGIGTSQYNTALTLGSLDYDYIFGSYDLGGSWFWGYFSGIADPCCFMTNLLAPDATADSTGLVFLTTGFHTIYETDGSGGVSGGTFWHSIGQAGSGGIPRTADIYGGMHTLGVSPLDVNHIAVTAYDGGGREILITTDGGADWTVSNPASDVANSGSWASWNLEMAAWSDNTTLYACNDALISSVRVIKSTDAGLTWTAADSGLPDVPVNKVLVDHRDTTGDTVFAATYLGVYRTTDGGQNWSLFGSGLPTVNVTDLYMPPDGSFLRIASYGRGTWEIDFSPSQPTLRVDAPAGVEAGMPFSLSVKALYADGSVNTAYTGTVHVSSNDSYGNLPTDYTFTSSDQGVHLFDGATLKTIGNRILKANDTSDSSLKGQAVTLVNPGPAAKFSLSFSGSTIYAGFPIMVKVNANDVFGNVATGFFGTVHVSSTDAQATVPPDFNLNYGSGSFYITFGTAGVQSITVAETNDPSVQGSLSLTISAAVAARFEVQACVDGSSISSTVTAGDTCVLRCIFYDQFGNQTSRVGSPLFHFTSSDSLARLPSDGVYYPNVDGGYIQFWLSLATAGDQTINISVSDTLWTQSATISVTVLPGQAAHLEVGAPSSVSIVQWFPVTVRLSDWFNNTATGYTGTIHFAASGVKVLLPPDYTFTAADKGVHTFYLVAVTPGTLALTVAEIRPVGFILSDSVSIQTSPPGK